MPINWDNYTCCAAGVLIYNLRFTLYRPSGRDRVSAARAKQPTGPPESASSRSGEHTVSEHGLTLEDPDLPSGGDTPPELHSQTPEAGTRACPLSPGLLCGFRHGPKGCTTKPFDCGAESNRGAGPSARSPFDRTPSLEARLPPPNPRGGCWPLSPRPRHCTARNPADPVPTLAGEPAKPVTTLARSACEVAVCS